MKSEENKSFSQLLREIESDASALGEFPDDFIRNISKKIAESAKQAKLSVRGLRILSMLVGGLAAAALVMLLLTLNYYTKAQRLINEDNNSQFDSISKKILGIRENDSIMRINYITDGKDSLLSYPDLIKEHSTFNTIKDSLDNYKVFEKMIEANYGVKMKVDMHGNQYYISLIESNNAKKSQLQKNIDKLKPQVRKIMSQKDSAK